MRLQYKASFIIFAIGFLVLMISSATYHSNLRSGEIAFKKQALENLSEERALHIVLMIESKIKEMVAFLNAPMIIETLLQSNAEFESMSRETIQKKTKELNYRWMKASDEADPFIQPYLTNPVARYLRDHMEMYPGEYGEIFLTNRYGIIVATTGKLTTLAHAHKYWWVASYAQGKGKVFLDDRGFDTSVKGYVLGIVVPVKSDNEIAGILKVNINITGALRTLVDGFKMGDTSSLKIVRSGGRVVLEKGKEPLSTKTSPALEEMLGKRGTVSFVLNEGGKDILFAYTPISSSLGSEKIGFGGSYESLDHILGNMGEFWYVILSQDLSEVLAPFQQKMHEIMWTGMVLILIMAITALVIGKKVSLPIIRMLKETQKIGHGDFEVNIAISSNDELGELARSFNKMTKNLKEITKLKDNYVALVSHDLKGPLGSMISCMQYLRDENLPPGERGKYFKIAIESLFQYEMSLK